MVPSTESSLPIELIFNPNWWHQNYHISFDKSFYFDGEARIENDKLMRRVMFERFGMGEPNQAPRPVIGSMYVAGGFILPALFGVEIRFSDNEAPWPVALNAEDRVIRELAVPDIHHTWPMSQIIADMDILANQWGYVVGDFDTDGILNTALHIRGQQLFLDFVDNPELAHHLFSVLAETYVRIASYMKARTGTCSVATNRSILHVDKEIYLHSNCSVQMISPKMYGEYLLPYERYMAEKLTPYGIHHCADNLQQFAEAYAALPLVFLDVGWGSDVGICRRSFPNTFLNLRLNPVRMLNQSRNEVRQDVERLFEEAGSPNRIGICCINMDYGTPDENIEAIFEARNLYSNENKINEG